MSASGVEQASVPSTTRQSDEVTVDVPGSADITGPARITYEESVRDFAIDVLNAASYREASARGSLSEDVQYTSAYFETAKFEVRNAGYVPRTPKWHPFARVLAPMSFTMTGVAIPLTFTEGAWQGWGFVGGATFVLGAALTLAVDLSRGGVK